MQGTLLIALDFDLVRLLASHSFNKFDQERSWTFAKMFALVLVTCAIYRVQHVSNSSLQIALFTFFNAAYMSLKFKVMTRPVLNVTRPGSECLKVKRNQTSTVSQLSEVSELFCDKIDKYFRCTNQTSAFVLTVFGLQ